LDGLGVIQKREFVELLDICNTRGEETSLTAVESAIINSVKSFLRVWLLFSCHRMPGSGIISVTAQEFCCDITGLTMF
jgi:hypothetical protein